MTDEKIEPLTPSEADGLRRANDQFRLTKEGK